VVVDDQHPAPRAEDEAQACPTTVQLRSESWELLELAEHAARPSAGVLGKAVGADQPVEVLDRSLGELDCGQRLQIVEGDGLPCRCLAEPPLRAFVGAVDAVEEGDHVVGIGVEGDVQAARTWIILTHPSMPHDPTRPVELRCGPTPHGTDGANTDLAGLDH